MSIKKLSGLMTGVTLCAGFLLLGGLAYADDSVVDQIVLTLPVSCTMTGVGMTSHNATIHNNEYEDDIGTTTLTAYCNDTDGFSIYAIGYTDDTYGKTVLTDSTLDPSNDIVTGTATSGNTSNWAMKLTALSGTYTPIIVGSTADTEKTASTPNYSDYIAVPSTYDKVAYHNSRTDVGTGALGAELTTTYAAYVSPSQSAGTYVGQVKYTLVHPASEEPLQPQTATSGCINYFANASTAEGTMGCQSISASDTSATLLASNFSREGYGFAGWTNKYDYATNPTQTGIKFYGPQETITFTAGEYTGDNNGLALYAVWIKSQGNLQDTTKVAELCGTGANALTTAPTDGTANLSSVSALTDQRDDQTYAIAKLADGKCWMIENLRLDDSATLTLANTNNPLNDGTNVTLKHSYSDTETHNTLSASQDPTAAAWCQSNNASCDDQSMLFTGNTTNRASSPTTNGVAMYSYGNYYNWYSATAGRGTYSFDTNNNSVAGDLCPAGWHLPKGGSKANVDVSDFWKLSRATVGADPANFANNDYFYYTGTPEGTDASNKMRAYPNNFVYSGSVYGGSVGNRGSDGCFWSSTAYSSSNAYVLYLGSSYVLPGTNYYGKYNGWAVRCVAPSGV